MLYEQTRIYGRTKHSYFVGSSRQCLSCSSRKYRISNPTAVDGTTLVQFVAAEDRQKCTKLHYHHLVPIPIPPPPPPLPHILRSYSSGLTALIISLDNKRMYSGDGSGTRRIDVVDASGEHTLSHKVEIISSLHVWLHVEELPGIEGSAALSETPVAVLRCSKDVNSLNYFR
ncbi:hypothetical protein ARMGADRAFT_1092741 [Armillaria gallica]|uniref:Uncharacterized protein n=1 Tax=Armillaria gallica TaxID=47427 RepID=A0A2H3CEX0_ARMGA|nr:hypothetical protein ARMGADRAFT_1092741 [Armillaria gallica]